MDCLTRRDAARLPTTPTPAGLEFWLMAVPVVLALFDAISTIIVYGVIAILDGCMAGA
jgi:hypothetical protein